MTSLKYFISDLDSLILIACYAILAGRESEDVKMALCKNCGTNLTESSKFCMKCGQRQEGVSETPVPPMNPIQELSGTLSPAQESATGNRWYQQRTRLPHPAENPTEENSITILNVYKQVFHILGRRPIKLWGVSLLGTLLIGIVPILAILPIISIPVTLVLAFGLTGVYIGAIRGKEPEVEQLFSGFNSFWRVVKGMSWKLLWVFIWLLIPVAGIVLAIIKEYSYRFVPHILSENSEMLADSALKISADMTQGHKLKMFAADFMIVFVTVMGTLFFALGTNLWPFEIFFFALLVIWGVLAAVFVPFIMGLVSAVFYERLKN